ncbi:MAG: PAS domain S-box protein, partial [Desulfobacterales bacterium]
LQKPIQKICVENDKAFASEMAVEIIDKEICEDKQIKQALMAEHIFRKTIEQAIPCGIKGIDLEGRIIYVNRVFCTMVGWNESELIGKTYPFPYWASEDMKDFSEDFFKLIKGNVHHNGIELPFRRKNGTKFWGFILNSQLVDSERKTIGQLISVADITLRKNAEKALRTLSLKLLNAQDEERKKVSRDLHDSIGAKLTGIKYSLEKLLADMKDAPITLKTTTKDLIGVALNTIEETRRIYKNLHPSVLDDIGLKAAIRDLIHEFQAIYSHINITVELDVQENEIADSLKIQIYRVIQEALNNIAKHSDANKA